MTTHTEHKKQEVYMSTQDHCSICAEETDDIFVSCASFSCTNRVHVFCAIRPEGRRLHFCSEQCITDYFNLA